MTKTTTAKSAKVAFVADEFERMLGDWQHFQAHIHRVLQESGQTAFYLNYQEITRLEVINGLAQFLQVPGRLEAIPGKLKRQNPGSIESKLSNPEDMAQHLSKLDPFGLSHTPHFEPPRGPAVPRVLTAAKSPLLMLPIPGGPEHEMVAWLTALDGAPPESGHTQKTLRAWMRSHPGFQAITILRHPLTRAYDAYCRCLLPKNVPGYEALRLSLIQNHGVPIPNETEGTHDKEAHRAGFLGFLRFLVFHFSGKSPVRTDPVFASQLATIQGFSQIIPPHMVMREDDIAHMRGMLAARLEREMPLWPEMSSAYPFSLKEIFAPALDDICFEAYRRDYLSFGFS